MKSEAHFHEMIHRKNPWKLETVIKTCFSVIKQHWKKMEQSPQSMQNFVRKMKQFVKKYYITWLTTQLVVIEIAPLTLVFCNWALVDLPAVKRYQFQYKVFVGLVWLTSNHILSSRNFWYKFLKFLKLPPFYSRNSKIFKNALGQFPKSSSQTCDF